MNSHALEPAGGPAFDFADVTTTVGCPVLAFFARAGAMLPML